MKATDVPGWEEVFKKQHKSGPRVLYRLEVRKLDYERYRVYVGSGQEFRQLATFKDGPTAIEYAKGLATFLGVQKHREVPEMQIIYVSYFWVEQPK